MFENTIKISVIGTGKMGFFHARLLSRLGILDSIVDTNIKAAENVGKLFNVPYYSSIEELSSERNPNGAIIAVPTHLHPSVSLDVLEKLDGLKGLIIEKPIAPSVEEANDLKKRITSKKDIKVIVGHVEVYNPVVAKICEIVQEKQLIGNPRTALIQRRGAVAETRITSIGDVEMDIGVHDFDIALRLFPRGRLRVYSKALKLNKYDNSCVTIVSSEESDFFATFLMSREYAGKLRKIDIEGTKATLTANLLTQILELRSLEIARGEKSSSAITIPFSNGEQIKVYGEPLLSEVFNLVDCIKGSGEPEVTLDDGINAVRMVEAVRKSISDGTSVEIKI
ncbi:MAG: Gfo/Idh/MocA family protein [Candidatus Hodarchaeales archaeon]